jgi:erythromycin esterase
MRWFFLETSMHLNLLFEARWRAGRAAVLALLALLLPLAAVGHGQARPLPAAGLLESLRAEAVTIRDAGDLDPLMARIGDARLVLLGESTHGSAELYLWRARITRRLIEEKGFDFVALEGEWPEVMGLDAYVKGKGGGSAREVLEGFTRWPRWLWANWEVAAFAQWLKAHNDALPPARRVGIYGLDLYGLWASLDRLREPAAGAGRALRRAAERLARCLAPFHRDPEAYAAAAARGRFSCGRAARALGEAAEADPETTLDLRRLARVAAAAERYYRSMSAGGPGPWNHRNRHMLDTLNALLAAHGPGARGVVWAHNSHIGDARATAMGRIGMVSLGQLARRHLGRDAVVLVGLGVHHGSVIAAGAWGERPRVVGVPPPRRGSWGDLLQRAGLGPAALIDTASVPGLRRPRVERAIGVVYHPRSAPPSYLPASLAGRYDAFLHLSASGALHPLHDAVGSRVPPRGYPWGFQRSAGTGAR